MTDPLTLSALGAVGLSKGIEFLYAQAGVVLDRWRARRDRHEAAEVEQVPVAADTLDGALAPARLDWEVLGRLAEDMEALRTALSGYVAGDHDVRADDEGLLHATEELRTRLELVLGQRLTFRGENREPTGTRLVEVRTRLVEVERSRTVGIRARELPPGTYRVDRSIDRLVDSDDIGFEID